MEIKLSLEVGYKVAQNSQGWAHYMQYIYNHRVKHNDKVWPILKGSYRTSFIIHV